MKKQKRKSKSVKINNNKCISYVYTEHKKNCIFVLLYLQNKWSNTKYDELQKIIFSIYVEKWNILDVADV
jgi:hypothetical protein